MQDQGQGADMQGDDGTDTGDQGNDPILAKFAEIEQSLAELKQMYESEEKGEPGEQGAEAPAAGGDMRKALGI